MKPGDASQLFARVGGLFELFAAGGDRFFHAAIENGMKDLLFALEVKIDCAIGYARLAGNISNLGVEITVVSKHCDSGAQNCFAFIGDHGTVGIN